MGQLKQLLPFRDGPLVQRAVEVALESRFDPVIVVLGSDAERVRSVLAAKPVHLVDNPDWETGMGSSIGAGIRYLQGLESDVAAVAVLLGDQPLIEAEHLLRMRRLLGERMESIIAARYENALGVPAIFRRSLFSALLSLPAEAGARQLLRNPAYAVAPFELPEAAADIDTPEDWARLLR